MKERSDSGNGGNEASLHYKESKGGKMQPRNEELPADTLFRVAQKWFYNEINKECTAEKLILKDNESQRSWIEIWCMVVKSETNSSLSKTSRSSYFS